MQPGDLVRLIDPRRPEDPYISIGGIREIGTFRVKTGTLALVVNNRGGGFIEVMLGEQCEIGRAHV